MSQNLKAKQTLVTLLLCVLFLSSCMQKSTRTKNKHHTYTTQQLYSTGELPPTNEADRFVINGTIDDPDAIGGSFVVNTIDGDMVALMFRPKQMHATDRASFNSYLLKGNKVKCVGTKLDPGVYALLAAKITEQ